MREVDFDECYKDVFNILNGLYEVVLATSYKDKVTARTINCILDKEKIYFLTSKAYTKTKQIMKNPNVAISKDNIQIEGYATILGHPNSEDSLFLKPIIENNENYKSYFAQYAKYKNTVLIEVDIKNITLYVGLGSYRYLNFELREAHAKGRN